MTIVGRPILGLKTFSLPCTLRTRCLSMGKVLLGLKFT